MSSYSSYDLNSILTALGAKSGLDVSSTVSNLIYAARAPERQWQQQQSDIQTQEAYLNQYNNLSSKLTDALNVLKDPIGAMTAMTATSSQSSIVTASAAAGTPSGSHIVKVQNLASTGAWYSGSVASATTALAAGSFTLQVGAASPKTIQVGSGVNTLNDLVTYINGQNLGVSASVVNDSLGSRLAIVSNASGDAGDFSITANPSLSFSSDASAWYSSYAANGTAALASGSFNLTVGAGSPVNIQVGSGVNTLNDLASYINGKSLGVTASVVSDANGSRLQLVNSTSGDSSGFTVSTTSQLGFTRAATGKNAALTVDGIPISSSTNTVTGAVNGLTLNLMGAAPDTEVTVSLQSDQDAAATAVNNFVSAYNTLVQQVNAQFKYNESTKTTGIMAGDSVVRMFQSDLLSMASYTSSDQNALYTNLGALGISMADDGTLSVDSTKLNDALQNHFGDVQTFFQGANSDGFAQYLNTRVDTYTDSTEGAFTIDLKTIGDQYDSLQGEIDNFEVYITSEQSRLTDYYNNVNVQLQQMTSQIDQIKALLDPGSSNK